MRIFPYLCKQIRIKIERELPFLMMKKLLIETYGCQMNVADSEVVASIMDMAGYEVCENPDEADAVFLNTCSVRAAAEQKILSRLEYWHSQQRKGRRIIIGVLGCMAERAKEELLEEHHARCCGGRHAAFRARRIRQLCLGPQGLRVHHP